MTNIEKKQAIRVSSSRKSNRAIWGAFAKGTYNPITTKGVNVKKKNTPDLQIKKPSQKKLKTPQMENLVSFFMESPFCVRQYRIPFELNCARKQVHGTFNESLAIKELDPIVKEVMAVSNKNFTKPPAFRKELATLLLAMMVPNINKYAKDMRKLKTAKKPWFTAGL